MHSGALKMSAGLSKENIAKARELLLASIFSDRADASYQKKEAVRQLLGPLMAARKSGLSFDQISEVLSQAGLQITANTLRVYFFDIKAEADTAREASKHAAQLARTKELLAKRRVAQANEVELASLTGLAQKNGPATPGSKNEPADAGEKPRRSPPASVAPAPSLSSEPVLNNRDKDKGAHSHGGTEAMTVDQIAEASLSTDEHAQFSEDLVVKDDYVYTASGAPFRGTLTKKQVHLLRTVGKLIAPTVGASSKDFVAMRKKL